MDGYNEKSCNALEKPFYRPVEAALRWCGLIAHEAEILSALNEGSDIPKTGQFPTWPCLQVNTAKILDAIAHGDIPHGRDGKTVEAGDHVKPSKVTVRHTDLREWMTKYYPGKMPEFLVDEVERNPHSATNADSFRVLQAEQDALKDRIEKDNERAKEIIAERDSLRAMVDKMGAPGERSETTYLNIIGGLLALMLGKSPAGKAQSVFDNQGAIIAALIAHHKGKPGIASRTLEEKFAAAKRSLNATSF